MKIGAKKVAGSHQCVNSSAAEAQIRQVELLAQMYSGGLSRGTNEEAN